MKIDELPRFDLDEGYEGPALLHDPLGGFVKFDALPPLRDAKADPSAHGTWVCLYAADKKYLGVGRIVSFVNESGVAQNEFRDGYDYPCRPTYWSEILHW